jgi:hypothetical protein
MRNTLKIAKPVLQGFSLLLMLFISACSSKRNNELKILKELNRSLENSNMTIQKSSEVIYHTLENKLVDPASFEKAKIWEPKGKKVYELSREMFNYINDLKNDLKRESSDSKDKWKDSFEGNNKKAVKSFFIKNGKGNDLYKKIIDYKEGILAIDSEIRKEFSESIIAVTEEFDTLQIKKDFTDYYFRKASVMQAMSLLTKFQNNIKVSENRVIAYCNHRVASHEPFYTSYSAIIGQSAQIVKPGAIIEITSGVAFSSKTKPEIIIEGKNVQLNEMAFAKYKRKSPIRPGNYKIPVIISYTDEYGKKQTLEKEVEYTVSNCKN